MVPAKVNLLKEIDDFGEITTFVVFTFGADLIFFERIILPKLQRAFCQEAIIFMDYFRHNAQILNFSESLYFVGKRYLISPVKVPKTGLFHGKLIFMANPEKAVALVGSGNLSFHGYGDNLEVFSRFEHKADDPNDESATLNEIWNLILNLSSKRGLSSQADYMLKKAKSRISWLGESYSGKNNIISSLDGSIYQQIKEDYKDTQIKEMTILSPFLDKNSASITTLLEELNPQRLNLIIQPGRTVANKRSLEKVLSLHPQIKLFKTTEIDRYVHAKAYKISTAVDTRIYSGSANFTMPGFVQASKSNFEMLVRSDSLRNNDANSFFDEQLHLIEIKSLELLDFQKPVAFPNAPGSDIKIAEISLDGPNLSITLSNKRTLPKHRQIKLISKLGEINIPIKIVNKNKNEFQTRLNDVQVLELQGSIPIKLEVLDLKSEKLLTSNYVWLVNKQELNKVRTSLIPRDETAGDILRHLFVEEDDQWKDFYDSLRDIVGREIQKAHETGIRHRPVRPKNTTTRTKKRISIGIYTDEEGENEIARIEKEIREETRLSALIKLASDVFPVQAKDPSSTPTPNKRKGKVSAPPKIGRKITNMVRRYARSLTNSDFLENSKASNLLAYISIFLKVNYLLFSHKVINKKQFLKLFEQIFIGNFGEPASKSTPFEGSAIREIFEGSEKELWVQNQTHHLVMHLVFQLKSFFSEDDFNYQEFLNHFVSVLLFHWSAEDLLAELITDNLMNGKININRNEYLDFCKSTIRKANSFSAGIIREWIITGDNDLQLSPVEESTGQEIARVLDTTFYSNYFLNAIATLNNKSSHKKKHIQLNWIQLMRWCSRIPLEYIGEKYLHVLSNWLFDSGNFELYWKSRFRLANLYRRDQQFDDAKAIYREIIDSETAIQDKSLISRSRNFFKIASYFGKM
jgi:hypothetical protein